MKLPQRSDSSIVLPSAVRAFGNGKLPREMLQPCGIRSFVMVEPAAGAMRAMVAAASGDGVTISATGTWRSYDQQKHLFESRYVTRDTGRRSKVWNGTRYWQLPNTAMAATPGTSNHGFGLAADLSNSPTVPIGGATLRWMATHGPSFGYWNTVRSEPWHWSYCLGDDVPDGVAAPPIAADDRAIVDWAAEAASGGLDDVTVDSDVVAGDHGRTTAWVQWRLRTLGHDIVIDGDFGPQTDAAVRAFQAAHGLEVDGRVGPMTRSALEGVSGGVEPQIAATVDGSVGDDEPTLATTVGSYVVQPGDGFLRIAKRTLWSSDLDAATAIAEANGMTLSSTILPGMVLEIPSCRSTIVNPGDDWPTVAERLGVGVDEIRSANAWAGDTLVAGSVVYGGRTG
jgi:hypothetical protein